MEKKDEFDIRVVSMSLVAFPRPSDGTDPVSMSLNNASNAGVVIVTGAGNDGPNNQGFDAVPAADDIMLNGLYILVCLNPGMFTGVSTWGFVSCNPVCFIVCNNPLPLIKN